MSRVLLLYGTTDGHTHAIVDAIDRALQLGGLQCDVVEACGWDPVPRDYVAVMVAASVHGGKYQRGVVKWVQRHAAELNAMPARHLLVSRWGSCRSRIPACCPTSTPSSRDSRIRRGGLRL